MIYLIITTSINNKFGTQNDERKERYLYAISETLKFVSCKTIIVENNGKRDTYLDQFKSENVDVYYTDNNKYNFTSKGVNEMLDVKEVIRVYDIKDDDIIIIGWSNIRRFRLAGKSGKWETVLWNGLYKKLQNLQDISEETVEQILVNRTSTLYNDEFMKRIDLLNKTFRNNTIIHWTPFPEQFELVEGFLNLESIQGETNGDVPDPHYSEGGHEELALRLMNKFKTN